MCLLFFRAMRLLPAVSSCASVLLILFSSVIAFAQDPGAQQPATALAQSVAIASYPESTSGLEHLAKDILKAQKENDGARANELLRSLVLPNPRSWYENTFGPAIAEHEGALYERALPTVSATLARFFLDALHFQADEVHTKRFDHSCDDDSGEYTFGILHARRVQVPLYEVRLVKGEKLMRIFAFAFVDGGFRFVLAPNLEGRVFMPPPNTPAKPSDHVTEKAPEEPVIRSGVVQSARLVHRVQPEYPVTARKEHLEGTVLLHALIAKDGSVQQLYVLKGYCSLSEAALDAVRQWRYTPTLLGGYPVEVDTQINVIYQLSR